MYLAKPKRNLQRRSSEVLKASRHERHAEKPRSSANREFAGQVYVAVEAQHKMRLLIHETWFNFALALLTIAGVWK